MKKNNNTIKSLLSESYVDNSRLEKAYRDLESAYKDIMQGFEADEVHYNMIKTLDKFIEDIQRHRKVMTKWNKQG